MTKKKSINLERFKRILPYFLAGISVIAIVFFGSLEKQNSDVSLSLDAFAKSGYKISVDQLSEMYVVADLSNAMNLASAPDVAANYVAITSMYEAGQVSTSKLEKPNITNFSDLRGVVEHIVADGETMESIAAEFGITTDQIRWSNNRKTTDIAVGDLLYIPRENGIVYTVKSGDTIAGIVSKYGGTEAEIIAFNDLEVSGVAEGMKILIKDGSLPETERPEYVAPVRTTTVRTYTYTFLGSSAERQNIQVVNSYLFDPNYGYPNPNPGVPGWCTWFAWYWRATSPSSLGTLGHEGRNANTWNYNYAYRGVGSTPRVGAVFQTPYGGGGYGHVGVVVGVNDDGSIVVQEMNYAGRFVVTQATIPAAYTGAFNYIY